MSEFEVQALKTLTDISQTLTVSTTFLTIIAGVLMMTTLLSYFFMKR